MSKRHEPIGEHDLNTSAGGRAYVAEFFGKRLHRHDFYRYISENLAADFACALAEYLRKRDSTPECQECGDGVTAHDPGVCGNCFAMKYRDAAGGAVQEPVAQYQTKLRNPVLPECDVWINVSEEGARTAREKYPEIYEVRELFERSAAAPLPREAATVPSEKCAGCEKRCTNNPPDCYTTAAALQAAATVRDVEALNKAIDKLIYTAWYSGEQDGSEGVSWKETGDSYNSMLRSRIDDDKKALLEVIAPQAAPTVPLTDEQREAVEWAAERASQDCLLGYRKSFWAILATAPLADAHSDERAQAEDSPGCTYPRCACSTACSTRDATAPQAAATVPLVDYDRVVSICDAHGINLPVECVEQVVEIVRLATTSGDRS
ncbi:hypothetical protein [Paraburkholderia youngii]|uniref:hypothetical protein n=1 Tax=Paraburkholderia youngii TaxID=2782701 RepID=UPI003D262C89